jgi:hypothetical protein
MGAWVGPRDGLFFGFSKALSQRGTTAVYGREREMCDDNILSYLEPELMA